MVLQLIFCAIICFSPCSKDLPLTSHLEFIESTTFEKYRVTARTRNSYGDNYWVDLIVEGNVSHYGNSIYRVYYDDGYGLKMTNYSIDYGYEDSYYVIIDYKTYYFRF